MHRHTGEALSDMAHLRQSVADILQTPIGSRVMRRDYGSTLFALIDPPQMPSLRLQIMAAIYALLRWEDRLTLNQLALSTEASGKMTVDLVGQRTDTAAPLTLTLPLRG
ncbi:baseplate assembly protein [BEV proteobacterium]|nr:baseplate assembly protein [Candidatus Symbiopectobacterium sp. Chty_BC]